jgi:hypothetical protein
MGRALAPCHVAWTPATRHALVRGGLFFLGALPGLVFLQSVFPIGVCVAAAAAFTAVHLGGDLAGSPKPLRRAAGWTLRAVSFGGHLLFAYLVITWGVELAWTTPGWVRGLTAFAATLAVATLFRPLRSQRVPFILPAGIWIAASLDGWIREEGVLRCDDVAAIEAQTSVRVLTSPSRELAACAPGKSVSIGRYPRKLWETEDGRLIVATGAGNRTGTESWRRGTFDGLICELAADGAGTPRCMGGLQGKAHGIADAPSLDAIYIAAWSVPTPSGGHGGALFRLPRTGPLEIVSVRRFEGSVADLYYSPRSGKLVLFADEGDAPIVTTPDEAEPTRAAGAACPSELRYDPETDRGIICGGTSGFASSFEGSPFMLRRLGDDALFRLRLSWGCDWDRASGKVYVAVPNFGELVVIDEPSGAIERSVFVGFGLRSVAYDRGRHRVYLSDFLGGDVLAIAADSGREVARWFAGRFVREVRLSRRGDALFVTSNAGIVRIALDPEPP